MCGFCEKIIKTDEEYINLRASGREFIFEKNGLFCLAVDAVDNRIHASLTDIKYCPICGRKLTDVEEKHLRENEEKFTKCDKCDRLEECKENGKVLNAQFECDEFPHYIPNIGTFCGKKKLKHTEVEELLDKIEKLNDRHQSDCIEINQLNVTIDKLVDKLSRLREVHGL